ncbi:MAG: DUF1801 domain-containing protein [Rhodobacteraceae bacterium]|nr:DUF1801 domain-containing protein [Paracoccaceae bacterium]
MSASSDEKVQGFLDDTQTLDPLKYAILQAARAVVFQLCPAASERSIYGGIMFSLDQDFGGLYVYQNHVSYVFPQGYLLDDPDGRLEGGGKYRRHLKLQELGDIEAKRVSDFVRQSAQK